MVSTSTSIRNIKSQTASFGIRKLKWGVSEPFPEDEMHGGNSFQLIWVKKGSGVHFIDMRQYDIRENQIFCTTPGQMNRMQCHEMLEAYVISFTTEFLYVSGDYTDVNSHSSLIQRFAGSRPVKVDLTMTSALEPIVHKMQEEQIDFDAGSADILRYLLKIFLIYLFRQCPDMAKSEPPSKSAETVYKFMELLDKNFIRSRMVSDYANDLCITPNYLNSVIKQATGFSASHHIRQRILLEAKRRAVYSNLSMKEIAYSLGFEDISHFSKFFKTTAGNNFTDFKKIFFRKLAV